MWLDDSSRVSLFTAGWQRYVGFLKLQADFRKRATNYRALLRKMNHADNASYGSSPLCIHRRLFSMHIRLFYILVSLVYIYVSFTYIALQYTYTSLWHTPLFCAPHRNKRYAHLRQLMPNRTAPFRTFEFPREVGSRSRPPAKKGAGVETEVEI